MAITRRRFVDSLGVQTHLTGSFCSSASSKPRPKSWRHLSMQVRYGSSLFIACSVCGGRHALPPVSLEPSSDGFLLYEP